MYEAAKQGVILSTASLVVLFALWMMEEDVPVWAYAVAGGVFAVSVAGMLFGGKR